MTEADLWLKSTDPSNKRFEEPQRFRGLAVGYPEELYRGESKCQRSAFNLCGTPRGQLLGIGSWILRSLFALCDHDQVHLAPCCGPGPECSPAGDVGIVGVRVDGECSLGNFTKKAAAQRPGHGRRLGSVALTKRPTSRSKSPASSKPL